MNTHKKDLTYLVRVVTTDGTEASIKAAAKQDVEAITIGAMMKNIYY